MRAASKRRGIDITSISRPIRPSDFKDFDLVLAMDEQNRGTVRIFIKLDSGFNLYYLVHLFQLKFYLFVFVFRGYIGGLQYVEI